MILLRRHLLRLGGCAAASLTLVPCQGRGEQLHSLAEAMRVNPPKEVSQLTLPGLDGKTLAIRDFTGRIVVLNFWATWCPPCVQELPALNRLAAGEKDFAVIAASCDHGGAAVVKPFLAAHGITRLIPALDPHGAIGRDLGVAGFPTTLIIGRNGKIRAVMAGPAAWDVDVTAIRGLAALG
jgi:thiol-disulfide isomerase/thioredoxin